MWVVTMFDLPMHDKPLKKAYSRFRKSLLKDGFGRMQFSVYTRCCTSRENAAVHMKRVEFAVPDDGEVRVFVITDKQYERMRIFWGKRRRPAEKPPTQLSLF